MEEQQKTQYRIGVFAIIILVVTSACADALTLIPFVGDFLGGLYFIILAAYLWQTGHGLVNWKILAPEIIGFVAEAIPAVQELPFIMAATIAIIIVSRAEDKTGLRLMPKINPKGVTPPRKQKIPLNQGKVRQPRKIEEEGDSLDMAA